LSTISLVYTYLFTRRVSVTLSLDEAGALSEISRTVYAIGPFDFSGYPHLLFAGDPPADPPSAAQTATITRLWRGRYAEGDPEWYDAAERAYRIKDLEMDQPPWPATIVTMWAFGGPWPGYK